MKNMMLKLKHDIQVLSWILKPSWLSGLLAVLAGLIVTGGVIIAFSANDLQLQRHLIEWQHSKTSVNPKLTTPDQVLKENDKPTLQGSWPLLIFWSILGLTVYFMAMFITKKISNAEAFRRSLGYVHANKQSMILGAASRIIFRLAIIGVWAGFSLMCFRSIVPYGIRMAHASAADVFSAHGITYALISFIVILLSVHLHAVFMRLSLGRIRVFTSVV